MRPSPVIHSWTSQSLLFAINAYRRLVSPLLRPRCRFEPSCSEYAAMAISAHGAIKGVTLACLRLLKCHPLHPGGIDPVPRVYRLRYNFEGPAVSEKNHHA